MRDAPQFLDYLSGACGSYGRRIVRRPVCFSKKQCPHMVHQAPEVSLGNDQIHAQILREQLIDGTGMERQENNGNSGHDFLQLTRGLKPMGSMWGTMTYADVQIAVNAARGSAQVDDADLKPNQPAPGAAKPVKPKPGAKPK